MSIRPHEEPWTHKLPRWGRYELRVCGTDVLNVRVCEGKIYFADGTCMMLREHDWSGCEWRYVGTL
jgi:hypothetical protein